MAWTGAFSLWFLSGSDWTLLTANLTTEILVVFAGLAAAAALATSELFGRNRSSIDPWLRTGSDRS